MKIKTEEEETKTNKCHCSVTVGPVPWRQSR